MLIRILILALMFAIRLPAQIQPEWKEPFPPHRIIGNVYYVGSKGLASYLMLERPFIAARRRNGVL